MSDILAQRHLNKGNERFSHIKDTVTIDSKNNNVILLRDEINSLHFERLKAMQKA